MATRKVNLMLDEGLVERARRPGPSRLVAAWGERRFVLVVSPLLLHELAEVLARPKFAR